MVDIESAWMQSGERGLMAENSRERQRGSREMGMGIAYNALRMHGGRLGSGSRYKYIFERGVVGYRYDMTDEI